MRLPIFLFFAVEVIDRFAAHESPPRGTHEPLLAVGIVTGFADRIIGDDHDDKIDISIVGELMRLARFENEGVAGFDRRRAAVMPNDASAG